MDSKTNAVAYETVELPDRSLPLLAPMSEVAGRMAPQVGASFLERGHGGRGVLLGGVSGVRPGKVVVIGAGMAGMNAAWIAQGMEAEVVVLDKNINKLRDIDRIHQGKILTLASNRLSVEETCISADLVIGAVLIPGAIAPKVVTEDVVKEMKPGSVLVDISVDQGGCFETTHMTTHSDPTYLVHDVVHYCVGNMPGAVPHTSTYGLTNATLPYVVALAEHGLETAVRQDPALALGVNVYDGAITYAPVAEAHGLESVALEDAI
jgi:alanine dehydrogenase